ncbi:MAG: PQQ-binding-like beta-propeller repeat protein [Spirochaetales bacterium]|nr:PQQ-binding-like beta-propeller repeat protein [Spirochaetales bacterium]
MAVYKLDENESGLQPLWYFDTSGRETRFKQITDRYLVINSDDYIHVLNGRDGNEAIRVHWPVNRYLGVVGDMLLLYSQFELTAFNIVTGLIAWETGIPADNSAFHCGDDGLYIRNGDEFWSLDLKHGRELWRVHVPQESITSIEKGVLLVTSRNECFSINPETGETLWTMSFADGATFAGSQEKMYIAPGKEIIAVQLSTGAIVWRRILDAGILGITDAHDVLIAETSALEMLALDEIDGSTVWRSVDIPVLRDSWAKIVHVGETTVVTRSGRFTLTGLHKRTGIPKWRRRIHYRSGIGQPPAILSLDEFLCVETFSEQASFNARAGSSLEVIDITSGETIKIIESVQSVLFSREFGVVLFSSDVFGRVTAFGALKNDLKKGIATREKNQKATASGRLTATMDPPEARIWIDGRLVGKGPNFEMALEAGLYSVVIELEGHATVRHEIVVESGENRRLDESLQSVIDVLWRMPLPGTHIAHSGIDAGYIIVSDTGVTSAVDAESGRILWQRNMALSCDPVGRDGSWYLPFSQSVEAVDTDTGNTRWVADRSVPTTALMAHGDLLLALNSEEFLYAISRQSSEVLWGVADIAECPLTYDGIIYAKQSNGPITAIDAITGKPYWRVNSTASPLHSSNLGLYVIDESADTIVLHDGLKGTKKFELRGVEQATTASSSLIVFTRSWSYNDELLSLLFSLNTGSWESKPQLVGAVDGYQDTAQIHSISRRNYVLDEAKLRMLESYNNESGWSVSINTNAILAETGGVLFVISEDSIRGIDRKDGVTVWERIFTSGLKYLGKDEKSIYVVSEDTLMRIGIKELLKAPFPVSR